MRRQPYYLSIFNHIAQQIYMGNIEVGDQLDSIKSMSEQYAAGMNTIRTVVRLLEERGFIATTRGKVSTVISSSGSSSQALVWLSERVWQIDNAYVFFRLLFPSLAVYGLKSFTGADFDELEGIVSLMQQDSGNITLFQRQRALFVDKLVSKSENSLMKEICYGIRNVVMLPRIPAELRPDTEPFLAPVRTMYTQHAQRVCGFARAGETELVRRELSAMYEQTRKQVVDMALSVTQAHGYTACMKNSHQDEFYLYDLLISEIIDQIFAGGYRLGDYLPSVASSIGKYQVSLPTVRKAYSLLGELGITKTANGKGTYITLFSDYPDDFGKSLDGLTRLTKLWEALQFTTVIVRDLALYAAALLSPEDAGAMVARLDKLHRGKRHHYYPAFVLLGWLVEKLGNPALSSTFVALNKDLVFVLYLERFFPSELSSILEQQYLDCSRALKLLEQNEKEAFSELISQIFHNAMEEYRAAFIQLGWPAFWGN